MFNDLLIATLHVWWTQKLLPAISGNTQQMKKCSETRKHCVLAVVRRSQNIAPPQTPFPGSQDGQNLISWRWSIPSPTDPVWWRSMHAISPYHGNSPTNTHVHKHATTNKTDYNTLHCLARSTIKLLCPRGTQTCALAVANIGRLGV